MSIPQRIWRVIKGRWLLAEEQLQDALADTAAAQELAESSRSAILSSGARATPADYRSLPSSTTPRAVHDPLAADLALLGAPPACAMETLDHIYRDRLQELEQESLPGGTADPA